MLDVKGKSIDDLTETITHELALHGSKLDDIVKAFRKGGKDAVDNLMQKDPGGEKDHKALGEKNIKVRSARNYHRTMQELTKRHKTLGRIYQNEVKKYGKGGNNAKK